MFLDSLCGGAIRTVSSAGALAIRGEVFGVDGSGKSLACAWYVRAEACLTTAAFDFPEIEAEAMTTLRADATMIVVAIALDSDAVQMCATALGDAFTIVVTHDPDAAEELLAVLRPRLVVATCFFLSASDTALLVAAAASCGAALIRVEAGCVAVVVAALARRAAAIEVGVRPPKSALRLREHSPPTSEEQS